MIESSIPPFIVRGSAAKLERIRESISLLRLPVRFWRSCEGMESIVDRLALMVVARLCAATSCIDDNDDEELSIPDVVDEEFRRLELFAVFPLPFLRLKPENDNRGISSLFVGSSVNNRDKVRSSEDNSGCSTPFVTAEDRRCQGGIRQ